MTIRKISKLVSTILLVIVLGFTVSVSFSLSYLHRAFDSMEFFGQQKDKIVTQVTQPIFSYLLTGDATILGNIERSLNQIKLEVQEFSHLDPSFQEPFIAMIDELQQTAFPELIAAGKLADPQAFLINNETQVSKHLETLWSYVEEANAASQAKKQPYIQLIETAQEQLINLSRVRQSFFSARKEMSLENINHHLLALSNTASELKHLPLLGVMKAAVVEEDGFSLGEKAVDKASEDKAIEPIREISSLLQRYNKDLAIAQKVLQDKLAGQILVNQQVIALQQRLRGLETELTAEYQFYERLVLIIIAVSALLIVASILICIVGGKRILNKISALEGTMSSITQTGDLSLRATVLGYDEIGSMALSFNLMVEQLQEASKLLKQKINDIQTMLKNMPQGLLSFDDQNKIKPEYSAYLEKILETDQVAGNCLIELLFEDSNLGSDTISQISAIAGACVGEDAMNFEFNQHLLVNEIEKELSTGVKKVLDLNWAPVVNEDDVVEQILLCVRDVTELRKLSAEAAEQKKELEIIGEILGVNQEKFHSFIASSLEYLEEIEKTIRANPNGGLDAINAMFRNMHTIKGNARTYGLSNLTHQVHDIESIYDQLRQAMPAMVWDQAFLLDGLAQLRQLIEYYARINEVNLGRKGPGRRGNVDKYLMVDMQHIQETIKLLDKVSHSDIRDLLKAKKEVHKTLRLLGTEALDTALSSIVASLPAMAQNVHKCEPNVVIHNGAMLLRTQIVGVIKDIFTHLFRNCLDHGLELPAVRLAYGKSAHGHIEVSLEMENSLLKIAIKDDGRGLALHKIREKALDKGLIDEQQALDDAQIAALIFLPGFSTADRVTDISGRGVGMDAVAGFARKEGGQVKINFLDACEGADYRQFETALYLPANCAVSVKESKPVVA